MKPNHDEIGVGATEVLSLRVSVGALVRVLFEHPRDGDLMLALERKATLHEVDQGRIVEVKSQPFGGAIRIRDLKTIRKLIGDFHFDSERSRSEQDFRLLIRPSGWSAVREFCVEHFDRVDDPVLEADPTRELAEEFADALQISLRPDQYIHRPVATVVEDEAAPTENIHAEGLPTARVYRIFEAHISDSSLAHAMLSNSESLSHQALYELAWEDAQNGGMGRANAILALPLKRITDVYLAMPPKERNTSILFEKNRLDETVAAVLESITVPKYQRL
ncbi:MAG TPA: hypothetical protein VFR47_10900 [Anaerolineales bacterium]|nr:hypothetical protein [Anaerolineales bacterium]